MASCETSKKVKEEVKLEAEKAVKTEETSKEVKEVKSEAEKAVKKSSLKERLQNIAKKSKRAKSYHTTRNYRTTWNSWNRPTTDYPDYGRTDSTQYPDYGTDSTQYPDYGTTRCNWSGCHCYASWQCSGSLNCRNNRCTSDYDYTSTPDYNNYNYYTSTRGYWDYTTNRYVDAEEYRDEEEENERDEERVNPRGKDSAVQPKSK